MRVAETLLGVLIVISVSAGAQTRKPGLWEVSTTMTWQQSPMPAGMPGMGNRGPQTTQVCVTQEQIDKYGAITPQPGRSCEVTNVAKTPNGMTADMVCTGPMSGKGIIEASWTDDGHAKSGAHFLGAIQMGPGSKPIEWTTVSSSVFKSADCGSVKPFKTQR